MKTAEKGLSGYMSLMELSEDYLKKVINIKDMKKELIALKS